MTGLLESLAEDEKALETISKETPKGDTDGKETGESYDSGKSRARISDRRIRRNAAPSPQNESGTPSEDGGASRGPRGDTPGSGEGTPGDAQAPHGDGESPRSGEELLTEDPDEPKTASDWAKYRRKLRETETEKNRLAKELEQARSAPKPEVKTADPAPVEKLSYDQWLKTNPKPDKEKDLAGYLVWNAERQEQKENHDAAENAKTAQQRQRDELFKSAKQEVEQIQADYRKENPDYDNAIAHAKQEYSAAVKKLMPQLTDAQVKQAIDQEIFNTAIQCAKDGTNLGEVLYDMAIERFGYQANNATGEVQRTPNLRVITNNKKRSASPLEGGGQKGQGRITVQQAANMSPAELLALPAEDLKYLESQGF